MVCGVQGKAAAKKQVGTREHDGARLAVAAELSAVAAT
jgi:hypothetical protein